MIDDVEDRVARRLLFRWALIDALERIAFELGSGD